MKPCGHDERQGDCGVCTLYETDARYNRLWGGPGVATTRRQPRPSSSCVHRGAEVGTAACGTCPAGNRVKLFACGKHSACTLEKPAAGYRSCLDCPDRETPPLEWVNTAQLVEGAVRLASLLPPDVGHVAGIPRSGMIPAAVVAAHLHLPLWELGRDGTMRPMRGHGRSAELPTRGRVVVIDDTVYSGAVMRWARDRCSAVAAVFATVYARPEATKTVDVHARLLPSPHLLEWNLFNNTVLAGAGSNPVFGRGVATDLDGILTDDTVECRPYLLPRHRPVPLIVTGRREGRRAETEAWLRRWGVRFARLEMIPEDAPWQPARHKARHYAESGCGLFFESEPEQAEEIFEITRLPVVCPGIGKVWQ